MKVYEAEKYIGKIEECIRDMGKMPICDENTDDTITDAIIFLGDYKKVIKDAIRNAEIKII